MGSDPKTLQEAVVYFSNPVNCREYLVARRWPDGATCPRCGSKNVLFLEKYNRWHCREKHSAPQFTLKTGTIFEDAPLGLDKWLAAMWQVVNCKNGVSSCETARAIGVTQKSAWFMDHRIRFALHQGSFEKMMSGEVEADETFVGGKARNMHKDKKERVLGGAGGGQVGKTAVLGILGRKGKVRTQVIPNRKRHTVQKEVRKHVEAGSALYTDQLESYRGLDEFRHQVVDQAVRYVDGKVHTNGLARKSH